MELTLHNILLVFAAVLIGVFLVKILLKFIFQIGCTLLLMAAVNRLMPRLMPWFLPFFTDLLEHFFQLDATDPLTLNIIQWVAPFLIACLLCSLLWHLGRRLLRLFRFRSTRRSW